MKYKAHTRYELKDGTYVPGTTTITGLENKPFLVPWANRLGLEGIAVGNKYEVIEYKIGFWNKFFSKRINWWVGDNLKVENK